MPTERRLIARCCSLGRWLLLSGLVCAGALVICRQWMLTQLDEQIRQRVQTMFADHYTGMDVRVVAARRIEGQGIVVRGLSIRSNAEETGKRELVYIDEIFLACRSDLTALVRGRPCVRQLVLRRMSIRATRYADGRWNIAKLLPLPDFGGTRPAISVEDSTIELRDASKPQGGNWALRDINVHLIPAATESDGQRLRLAGTMLGDHFKRVSVRGWLDPDQVRWSAWGTIDGLEMSQRMLGALPADVAEYLSFLATLRARAHFEFRVGHDPGDAQPVRYVLKGHLSEGRVDDPRLPYPLTEMDADVYADNSQLRIENVTARSGPSSLALSCVCKGFSSSALNLQLSARVTQLALDRRLYNILPADFRTDWQKYDPAGLVDLALDVTLSEDRWQPVATVTCRDVSFAYYKFPYRLQHARGVIHLEGNQLRVSDFMAQANGQAVVIDAQIQNPGPDSTGWLTLHTAGSVALDDNLIAAMTPEGQRIVRAMHPTGSVRLVDGRVERLRPGETPHTRWEIDVQDCTLQYDRFPYPIQRIGGKLILVDRHWEFRDLHGFHGSNYILCSGTWTPAPQGQRGGVLGLDFHCSDVPLDEALRDAVGQMNAGAKRFWNSLHPRGTVDRLNVSLRYDTPTRKMHLDVFAEKWPPAQNVEGRSVSLHPDWLPLRLNDVTGRVRFVDGEFWLEKMTGKRAASQVEWAGHGNVFPDQRWQVQLTRLIADRVDVDHELIDALPQELRPAMRQLKYRGALGLNGTGWLRGGENLPLDAGWDVLLDMEDGFLDNALQLEHIHGGVRLIGQKEGTQFSSRGELEIDSLICRGAQITQIQGPLWLDPRQLLLGARAEAGRRDRPPRQVTAKTLGGNLTFDASMIFDPHLPFVVDLSLADGDAAQIARQANMGRHDVTGKVNTVLHLSGAKAGWHTLRGRGQIRLRDADVYELPVMVALLSVLSLHPPDTNAFTRCDVDFRINGEQAYLDRIDFSGDAISLKGNGWMDLSRRINLDFYALVGRHEWQLPIIKDLLAEASRNILLIQVVGTVDQPNVIRKPLPELDETLQRIFPEVAGRQTATPLGW